MSMQTSLPTLLTPDSRCRILDAAETLFAANGFSNTSMRSITSEAGVNLASVNYYFGSKDQLMVEVLSRAIRPLNEQRIKLLEAEIQHHGSDPIPLPRILNALIRPCLEISFDPDREKTFQLLGRSLSEEGNFIEKVIEQEWIPIVGRFMEVLKKSLPKVPEEEIYWRIHFTVGAMIHSSCHHKDLTLLSSGLCKMDMESTLQRLISYASAGLIAASVKLNHLTGPGQPVGVT
jgi:AcrR family transcriptional regulator